MALVLMGVVFVLMHWAGVGPPAYWPWWALVIPFGLAVLWWAWSDSSGRTRRLQDQKTQKRIDQRRERAVDALGLNRRRVKPPRSGR